MNLKYLKQFLDLSHYVSMNQYAAQNNITHAQVSRMVMELEKDIGNKLLIRDKSQSKLKIKKKKTSLFLAPPPSAKRRQPDV